MAQGQLWETVPAIGDPIKQLAVDLSVERSRGGALRLATILPEGGAPPFLIKVATENASRLRALSVQCMRLNEISDMISKMLRAGALGELSELSIRHLSTKDFRTSLKSKLVIPTGSPEQENFNRLINSLSIIRLGGLQMDWGITAFSSRLVELHIQMVELGNTGSDMTAFLLAISTANELRTLKLAFVIAYRSPHISTDLTTRPRVVFPKLQFLLLSDLYFDVLQSVLLAIAPGSYHFRIDILASAFETVRANFDLALDRVGVDDMAALLSLVTVDTLFIFRGPLKTVDLWLSGFGLRKILEAMPGLKELKMHGWVFDRDFCNGLGSPSTPGAHAFPKLEALDLIQSRISDMEGFKNLVMGISAQTMQVGGYTQTGGESWVELRGDDDTVGWLRSSVPTFRLVDPNYVSPELKATKQILW